MSLCNGIGRGFRRFLHTDITRVLVLDTRHFRSAETAPGLMCASLDVARLSELASDGAFGLSNDFVEDFRAFGFTGIVARWHDQPVGICFLAERRMPARHNRGGEGFRGIGLSLPDSVQFLFKVEVLPQWRGRRVHATMIRHAIEHFGTRRLSTIVTTTDWRNRAFLSSARRQGFKLCGFASEIRLAGTHLYRLPDPIATMPNATTTEQNDRTGQKTVFRVRETEHEVS